MSYELSVVTIALFLSFCILKHTHIHRSTPILTYGGNGSPAEAAAAYPETPASSRKEERRRSDLIGCGLLSQATAVKCHLGIVFIANPRSLVVARQSWKIAGGDHRLKRQRKVKH